jgi:hypothetical protein
VWKDDEMDTELDIHGRVVVCGSMHTLGVMRQIADVLQRAGVPAVVPTPDEDLDAWSLEASNRTKREASRRHMSQIRDTATAAVLVVNVDRRGEHDYIGPNAFAEIGVAFADERPVFLLQGMPDAYADELMAWEVHCLHGDLRPLLSAVGAPTDVDVSEWRRSIHTAAV